MRNYYCLLENKYGRLEIWKAKGPRSELEGIPNMIACSDKLNKVIDHAYALLDKRIERIQDNRQELAAWVKRNRK